MKNNKWICEGCHSWNQRMVNRCSFCSKPRPIEEVTPDTDAVVDAQLTQQLHNIIETLTSLQKKKLFRYFEDNVL